LFQVFKVILGPEKFEDSGSRCSVDNHPRSSLKDDTLFHRDFSQGEYLALEASRPSCFVKNGRGECSLGDPVAYIQLPDRRKRIR